MCSPVLRSVLLGPSASSSLRSDSAAMQRGVKARGGGRRGVWSRAASSVSQRCGVFPCAPALGRRNLIPIFTGGGTGSTGKTKSEDVCGPSGVSLERREFSTTFGVGGLGGKTLVDRWTDWWTQTLLSLRSGLAGGGVLQKSLSTATATQGWWRAVGRRAAGVNAVCVCVFV